VQSDETSTMPVTESTIAIWGRLHVEQSDFPRNWVFVMSKVLIQFAHPAFSKSRAHRALIGAASRIDGVTINDLYELYPDLNVDAKREQMLVREHDVLILQFPIYWYSGPALIKQWLDLVLEYGWAYGHDGNAVRGKRLMCAVSCGSDRNAYAPGGDNGYPFNQFLLPFRQTAVFCGMSWLPPFVAYGNHWNAAAALEAHGTSYAGVLRALTGEHLSPASFEAIEHINDIALPATRPELN
jgi:glutathione-regulated potassium-efflux system ancillary protein KefG